MNNFYFTDPLIGAGLPVLTKHGAIAKQRLIEHITQMLLERNYFPLASPHIGNLELFEKSGHWPYYKESMFPLIQKLVENEIYVDKCILEYVCQLVRTTREHPKIEIGSSPRGGLALVKVSRAMALINGRDFVTPDDVKMFAVDVLAHRIILHVEQVLEGAKEKNVVEKIVESVPAPKDFYRK